MSIICIDINKLVLIVNKVGWHTKIKEDVENKNIKIAIGGGQQKQEIGKVNKVKRWLLQLERVGKIERADDTEVTAHQNEIEDNIPKDCAECDDPHLLAVCHHLKIDYLISEDDRINSCRHKIKKVVCLRKFCKFKFVKREAIYNKHRVSIIK